MVSDVSDSCFANVVSATDDSASAASASMAKELAVSLTIYIPRQELTAKSKAAAGEALDG